MCFYVSKLKFIITELFTSLLIPILCTIFLLLSNVDLAISSIFWLLGFLFFALKIDWYWHDQLYINANYIKLNRTKISGAHEIIYNGSVKESEYVIEHLHSFTETPTKFILYGDAHVENKDSIGSLGKKSLLSENSKNMKKVIIRKNFKDNKKIKELLSKAVI